MGEKKEFEKESILKNPVYKICYRSTAFLLKSCLASENPENPDPEFRNLKKKPHSDPSGA